MLLLCISSLVVYVVSMYSLCLYIYIFFWFSSQVLRGMQWQTNRYNSWTKEIVCSLQKKHYKRVIHVQRPPASYDHVGHIAYAWSPLVWSCLGVVSLSVLQHARDPVTAWRYILNQCDGAAHTILLDYLGQVRRSAIYTVMESGLHSSEDTTVNHRLHPPEVAIVNGQCHRSETPMAL
jgi:hypothetical protein